MGFIIGLLTFILILDCAVLVLLVLIQLPKKEAGAGVAFGGAATDALFGAGSGNVLTKTTKYAAASFFILALGLSLLQSKFYHRSQSEFLQHLQQPQASQEGASPQQAIPPGAAAVPPGDLAVPANTNPAVALSNITSTLATNTGPTQPQ